MERGLTPARVLAWAVGWLCVVLAAVALAALVAADAKAEHGFPQQGAASPLCQGDKLVGVEAVVPTPGLVKITWGLENPCASKQPARNRKDV